MHLRRPRRDCEGKSGTLNEVLSPRHTAWYTDIQMDHQITRVHLVICLFLHHKKERNILCTITRRKANCICHILHINYLLKYVTEGEIEENIEVTRRRCRCKQLVYNLKEMRRFWKLKEVAVYRNLWRIWFGRGCGLIIRQTDIVL